MVTNEKRKMRTLLIIIMILAMLYLSFVLFTSSTSITKTTSVISLDNINNRELDTSHPVAAFADGGYGLPMTGSDVDSIKTMMFEPMEVSSLKPESESESEKEVIRVATEGNVDDEDKKKKLRLVKYLNKYKYTKPWKTFRHPHDDCGTSPEYDEYFSLAETKHSRLNEDQIIYERFFKNSSSNKDNEMTGRSGGTYVELGAFDGKRESNTRFFDICLGWKGLLIEGNPVAYRKLRQERKMAHRMCFAPSCSAEYEATTNGTVQFYPHPMPNSGLLGKALTYAGKSTISVPCGPLGPVLVDVFEGERINFFSLDVEGAETAVLETVDFTKIHIDVFMIEVENSDCPKNGYCEGREKTRKLMANAGYQRLEGIVVASDVYLHPESEFRISPLPSKLKKPPTRLRHANIEWIT